MNWKLLAKVAVSVVLLAVLFTFLPWPQVREAVGRLSPVVWVSVLAGFLAGHRLAVVKWRRLVNTGRAELRPGDATRFYAAGLFANICLPSIVGGDVLRAALAARATGRPEATVLGSIADRLVDIVITAVLLTAGAVLIRDALPARGAAILAVVLVAGLSAAVVAVPLLLRRPIRRWPARLRRPVGRSLVALRYLARDRTAASVAVAVSVTVQAGFVLLNAWIGHAIGVEVPLAAWFFAWPLAKLAALLPISLNGLAVRDATLAALLLPMGVPMALGVVASLIWQSILIVGGLIGGLYWWLANRRQGIRWAETRRFLAIAPGARGHG